MSLCAAHTFAIFADQAALSHGCFHRHGGISPAPYDSLNISFGVGDEPENVHHNRALVKRALGCSTLVSTRQVHGDKVAVIEAMDVDAELDGYDALITAKPGVALLIQQADCQAILLHDPQNRVIANIHCGWRGSVANIIAATLSQMMDTFNCNPAHVQAAISPALGSCCAEFINYKKELPEAFYPFEVKDNHFDFPAISAMQLQKSGLKAQHIEVADICTRCNHDWFSFRRRHETGRFCSAIGLLP
ncbi:MAG: peptidoglycan editing factor PgeF [Proteobacteria bacterium]|nr:peptidoglycan editing factor PgeF [Pseudomonadota bacterium]MBU1641425.1 peptidoglycan editing factor PgeF [Pseudomonadota bacterium]